jgi:glyoxylase-like metal-dependent hydrolase (beta-lactamase superfamily II)
MTLRRFATLLIATACACAPPPTPEQEIVNAAAAALGGADRIRAVKTLAMEGSGRNFNLGQDMIPGASGQTFTVTSYRRAIDLGNHRARTEQTRTPAFLFFQGPQAQTTRAGIDGDVGYNIGAKDNATRIASAAARDRQVELYHHPLKAVRAALDPASKLANPRTAGAERAVDVTPPPGHTFTLVIDGTGLPARVTSKSYNANLGDVTIETSFGGYTDANGLKLPASLTTKTDDFTTAEITIAKYAVDGDTGDLTAPAAAASAAAITGPPPAKVDATEVAKGVWWLAGQSHHSVLAEFADHLVLIEAPQSEGRTLAVIAKAKELVPSKPLTRIVTSHHHFDHTAGIRAAIAEGMTVVTHKANAAFFEEVAKRPHTLQPDTLQKNPKPVKLEPVDDALTLKDSLMTIELYHVAGNPHSDSMLMAYFPRERVVVEADAYSPGGEYQPYAPNLLENIQKRKLRVDRVVPLHGSIVPFAELTKSAAAQKPATTTGGGL